MRTSKRFKLYPVFAAAALLVSSGFALAQTLNGIVNRPTTIDIAVKPDRFDDK